MSRDCSNQLGRWTLWRSNLLPGPHHLSFSGLRRNIENPRQDCQSVCQHCKIYVDETHNSATNREIQHCSKTLRKLQHETKFLWKETGECCGAECENLQCCTLRSLLNLPIICLPRIPTPNSCRICCNFSFSWTVSEYQKRYGII